MRMRLNQFVMAMAIMAALAWMSPVFATALTASRNTLSRSGAKIQLTMASNVVVYAGSLVCVDSSGLANPAADTSGFAVIGMAEQTVDNRTAVYSATKKITVVRGVFRWANADVIVAADIGKIVYVTDDATVNKTGGGQNIIAGSVVDVDDDGVWVDTAKIGPIGAATPSSLSVSGISTFTGVATFTVESVHNGGMDGDYLTTDAGLGVDTKTAGTLALGASTATKVEIADTGVGVEAQGPLTAKEDVLSDEIDTETATALLVGKATATTVTIGAADTGATVPGTFGVTGVATFTARPVFNAAYQVAPTNALLLGMPVTINGTNYVIGVYPVNQ